MIQAWYIYHKTSRSVPYVRILSPTMEYLEDNTDTGHLENGFNKFNCIKDQDALNIQGLDSADTFRQLPDQDIKDLCDACRKPGGTIVNPNAAAPNAPAHIPNPGIALSFVSMKGYECFDITFIIWKESRGRFNSIRPLCNDCRIFGQSMKKKRMRTTIRTYQTSCQM